MKVYEEVLVVMPENYKDGDYSAISEREILSLRDKTHSLSNHIMGHQEKLGVLELKSENTNSRLDYLYEIVKMVKASHVEAKDKILVLESQSKILKWLLGFLTAVVVAGVSRFVSS